MQCIENRGHHISFMASSKLSKHKLNNVKTVFDTLISTIADYIIVE